MISGKLVNRQITLYLVKYNHQQGRQKPPEGHPARVDILQYTTRPGDCQSLIDTSKLKNLTGRTIHVI